jgi:hypothetical protein
MLLSYSLCPCRLDTKRNLHILNSWRRQLKVTNSQRNLLSPFLWQGDAVHQRTRRHKSADNYLHSRHRKFCSFYCSNCKYKRVIISAFFKSRYVSAEVNSNIYNWKIKNQLDATYYFIVLLIESTCFGHYYAYHQELAVSLQLNRT